MPIGNITQSVSTIPAPPHRGVDVQTVFVNKQEDFQDHLADTTIDELNTLKDQLNLRIGEINSTATTMNGYADTASTGASTATTKAGEASTSASDALSYKNQAETFKNNASTSATKASQWADNNYNVEVEAGKYSAKHWSTVAQNTVNNKIDKVVSIDNAIVRFNGTTGEVQNSAITIDDNGNIGSGTQSFNGFGGSGFKNHIINGNFDIWQRGTSFTLNEYNADRWFAQFDGNCTVSKEVVSYNNTAKLSWTAAGTYKNFLTSVEDGARKLQGKTLTFSFMAKASTAGICSTYIGRGQGAGISANIDSVTINLTTSWQKFTRTFTMPAYDNANMTLVVGLIAMQLLGSSNTVWIKEVQLEEGSIATPFDNRPYGLELALCQRYYEKVDSTRCNTPVYGTGTGFIGSVKYKVPKRTTPTISLGDASHWRTIVIYNGANLSTFNAHDITAYGFEIEGTSSAGNIAAGYAGKIQVGDGYTDNGTDGIFVSAEL